MTNYKQERNRDAQQDANTWLIVFGIVIATVFMCFGLFIGLDAGRNEGKQLNDAYYENGYKKAKLIYQCDHDKAECELLKD